jgi:hypothetical protein
MIPIHFSSLSRLHTICTPTGAFLNTTGDVSDFYSSVIILSGYVGAEEG